MLRSSHCRRMDSLLSFLINLWDWFSASAKAVLEKVSFQSKLAYGFQHLILFLLQGNLLPPGLLGIFGVVKGVAGVCDKFLFPVSKQIWTDGIVVSHLVDTAFALKNFEDYFRFEFW